MNKRKPEDWRIKFRENFWQDKDENDKVCGWLAMKTEPFEGQPICKIANPDDVEKFIEGIIKDDRNEYIKNKPK